MNRKVCIGTAFYHARGRSPNLRRTLSERRKLEVYYKCIAVFFASARRFYRNEQLILFTNAALTKPYQDCLDAIGVETLVIPESEIGYCSDRDIVNRFPGCLFTLDVIDYISRAGMFDGNESVCLFDSDCIFLDRIGFLDDANLPEQFLSGIRLDYPVNHNVNGQTRTSLGRVLGLMDPARSGTGPIDYYGGEYFAYASSMSAGMAQEIGRYFAGIKQHIDDFGNTYTEEHLLSMLMSSRHAGIINDETVVKRVWTADNYNNIDGTEREYPVLHLPAEKGRFMAGLFGPIAGDADYLNKLTDAHYEDVMYTPVRSCANPSLGRRIRAGAKRLARRFIARG